MNAKRGRPPKDPEDKRDETIRVPLTKAEKDAIDAAAGSDGKKPTTWAHDVLVRTARKKRAASGERGF
jgi:hypothetical protein